MVNPGQTVSLVCITTGGEPSPLLNWASSNDSLPSRSLVKGGTLTLPAISSDEAGVYSCVASNNVGNPAKKSTTIVVRGERGGRRRWGGVRGGVRGGTEVVGERQGKARLLYL